MFWPYWTPVKLVGLQNAWFMTHVTLCEGGDVLECFHSTYLSCTSSFSAFLSCSLSYVFSKIHNGAKVRDCFLVGFLTMRACETAGVDVFRSYVLLQGWFQVSSLRSAIRSRSRILGKQFEI